MSKLSVVIITKNEERNIGRCLESVRTLAEEMIVLDSESEDQTRSIAESLGARVITHPWEGSFTKQKNAALALATCEWILCLDADEWITPELANEIEALVTGSDPRSSKADGFSIDRHTIFLGQFMHCWSPDWILRLVKQDRAKYVGGLVHEQLEIKEGGKPLRLEGKIEHDAYQSIEQYIARLNRYTTLAATSMHESGRKFRLYKLLLSPPNMALRMFLLKGGWRDGIRGFILCLSSGFYELTKYAKLYALQLKTPANDHSH